MCECPVAGFCKRHNVFKPDVWHRLCRTRPDYRELWEQGRGPGQVAIRQYFGLGDLIAWIAALVGIKPKAGCQCDKRRAWLNRVRLWWR